MTKRMTFEMEHYIEPFSSNVHSVLKVFIEDKTLIYHRDFGYTDKNILDMIGVFLQETEVMSMQSTTYTIDISDGSGTYSVTDMNPKVYITDDTI